MTKIAKGQCAHRRFLFNPSSAHSIHVIHCLLILILFVWRPYPTVLRAQFILGSLWLASRPYGDPEIEPGPSVCKTDTLLTVLLLWPQYAAFGKSTHTNISTNRYFNSWWFKWHVSGPGCTDSFTGSCQHNEPSEASNEAIRECGKNNPSTVNSVVRISQRVDHRLSVTCQSNFITELGGSTSSLGTSSLLPQNILRIKFLWKSNCHIPCTKGLSCNHKKNCWLFRKSIEIFFPLQALFT